MEGRTDNRVDIFAHLYPHIHMHTQRSDDSLFLHQFPDLKESITRKRYFLDSQVVRRRLPKV